MSVSLPTGGTRNMIAVETRHWMSPSVCHRLSLLSLRLASRTISSICCGCNVGSSFSFARHVIKILVGQRYF